MCIDWDFGNKRLKAGEVFASGQGGTKPSTPADVCPPKDRCVQIHPLRRHAQVQCSRHQWPQGSIHDHVLRVPRPSWLGRGTRYLSRFNPKAMHVDFYDLHPQERDMLPYEFHAIRWSVGRTAASR